VQEDLALALALDLLSPPGLAAVRDTIGLAVPPAAPLVQAFVDAFERYPPPSAR
jgi:hypothetical protein